MAEATEKGPEDEPSPKKGRIVDRVRKKLRRPTLKTSLQTVNLALLTFRLWDVLQQHEALITGPVMSAYAEMVNVIGLLAG